ncbi:bacterial extracellular solute-binding s, 5 Middle family protein [Clostridium argentinense CDC 2741]|uniref:Bacterial extracellular solute-binding s, 5 Middle family protein n=1 Tax=Clostridium argentinense CDC 2741 TaxID=1418104 RepID=A0A0C1U9P8_9CLOT|nr:peptide ABC transporter substrate-binding protein [Clostridium argentinense]ARC84459.1 peptide ABC transporter substrate-binding protein [Clostridium argentinense]KIE44335.1 bacterial extracellular solute-binding s, 5 Middle family protein [Clostridium argentinense CDC 2741]NFF38759.1 peptide ABC transporter substrate-binding protein [Clostridium argentinense]NFP48984.1 peptide ABC transporter substrate-binding protein [Clostridium argentinense]NFP72559.1 peptide ABC transporter substrate-b
MKSRRLLAALLTVSLTTSVVLVGCGKKANEKPTESDNKETSEVKMDKEQYLNVLLQAEPRTLDPSKSTDGYSSEVLTNVMESLTRLQADENGKGTIVSGAAEKWEQSEDGLTWTFHIRDMKWSDGQPVTAEQFVYSIKRTLNPETASQYAFLLYPIKNAEAYNGIKAKAEDVGVKAVDEKTLEFTLERPCSYFLDLTYFKVMEPQRQDIIEKNGDKYGTEADTMVFCGPFTIKEWVHNNKVELVKNPEYWDAENVKLEKATMKIIKEANSRMNELYNGSLDLGEVNKPEWIEKLDKTEKFNVKRYFEGGTTYTFFNQNTKYFKNAKIRKAFIIARDREGTVKTLYKGIGEPATAFCTPAVKIDGVDYRDRVNYSPVDDLKKDNPDPKALFIEGLKELGLDPDPSKHTIKMIQSGTSATNKEFAEFEQQNYKNVLGVNIEPDYCEWAVFQSRTDEGDYEAAGQTWVGDYNDPSTFFDIWLSNAGINNTGWKSEKYDEIVKKANGTKDPEEKAKLFKEAEKILIYEEAVINPGIYRYYNTYLRNYVKNYSKAAFGSIDLKNTYTDGRE